MVGASAITNGGVTVQEGPILYSLYMTEGASISVSDAREQLAAIIDRARTEHEPVFLTRRGKRVAAVIDADDLEHLIALAEDMTDIRAAQGARDELRRTQSEPVPWDEVKADLGLM